MLYDGRVTCVTGIAHALVRQLRAHTKLRWIIRMHFMSANVIVSKPWHQIRHNSVMTVMVIVTSLSHHWYITSRHLLLSMWWSHSVFVFTCYAATFSLVTVTSVLSSRILVYNLTPKSVPITTYASRIIVSENSGKAFDLELWNAPELP